MKPQYTLVKQGKQVSFSWEFTSLAHLLEKYASTFADKDAISFLDDTEQITVSYKQLHEIVRKTASFLYSKGLKKADSITFIMKNSPEVLFLNLACWSSSLVSVPLDSKRDTHDSMLYKISQTQSKILFIKSDALEQAQIESLQRSLSETEIITFSSVPDFISLIENTKSIELSNTIHQDALVLYTSGTTALPRGAILTLEGLISNADSIASWMHITEQDRFFTVLPLHHINSTTFTLATLLKGGTVILVPRYSNSGFFRQLAQSKATLTSIVPTICHDQLSQEEHFEEVKDSLKLTRIQIGSAPVQPQEAEEFVSAYNIPLIQGYGQTETSLRSTGVPYAGNYNDAYFELLKSNTIGAEMKWTNVSVLIDGRQAGEGELGEVCIRGPGIMKEYLNDPNETNKAFAHGWFHSGDMGYWRNIHGHILFFLVGRIKEIIIKGGINISPLAVENMLKHSYPEIDQVYVAGFEDLRLGEDIGAAVVFKESIDANKRQQITERILVDGKQGKIHGLSAYESPAKIIELSQDQLPMTSTGKVQRTKIKELFVNQTDASMIAKTHAFVFRIILPSERYVIKAAVAINNERWFPLVATEQEFVARAKNGILIGAFDHKGNVQGTVSALRNGDARQLMHTTYDALTNKGTLSTNKPDGKLLVCIAISTIAKEPAAHEQASINENLKEKAAEHITDYLESDRDPIVRFHRKAKGGKPGAQLVAVIKDGRAQDVDALGYSIVFAYPELDGTVTINENASLGVQLIEAAMKLALQLGIKQVYAYSRPAGFRKYMLERLP